jgi:hypothetical protein
MDRTCGLRVCLVRLGVGSESHARATPDPHSTGVALGDIAVGALREGERVPRERSDSSD